MAVIGSRSNTFKVDFNNFKTRPSFADIHSFVNGTLGLRPDQLVRLQMHHVHNCAYIKCIDQQTAEMVVNLHNEKHHIVVDGVQNKVHLSMDDGCILVKVHDLSENVTNDDITVSLKQYGEVHYVKEQVWGSTFAYKGISSGVRIAKMTLRRHIKSVITIQTEQTLISYKNQPKSCLHCLQPIHPGKTCTDNRKANRNTQPCSAKQTAETMPSLTQLQNPADQTQRGNNTDQEQQPQRPQRNVRKLSTPESTSPPPKRVDRKPATASTTTKDEESDNNDSDMDSVSSVNLTDSEPEPARDDVDKWIERFNKHSRKVEKKMRKLR